MKKNQTISKTLIAVLVLVSLGVMSAMPVSALHFWNYDIRFYAAYGTPEINGTVTDTWDAAPVIEIRLNDCPLYAQGYVVYQNQWANVRHDEDYHGRYRIMWDMDYIYFLEERTGTNVNLSHNASQPWYTDGVLAFTQVSSPDGRLNPDGISVHIFWIVGDGDGNVGGQVMARIADMTAQSREIVEIPGARIVSSLVPGGYVVTVAIPWAFYREFTPAFTPSAGTVMGISFVIHDSQADFPSHERQILFPFDQALVDETIGGYDFGGWGTLELLAAPVVTLPAELPQEEQVEEQPAEQEQQAAPTAEAPTTTPAPQTGTPLYILLAAAVLAVIGAKFAMRRRTSTGG